MGLRERWEKGEIGLLHLGIYMTEEERTKAFDKEAAIYCSQNNRNCNTCSLVNYGHDCHNNPMKSRCQECGAVEAIYNPETMSASLCPACTRDRINDNIDIYDYPCERED